MRRMTMRVRSHSLAVVTAGIALNVLAMTAEAWQPDEFPIGYWLGPPAAFNRLKTWQTVKDGNFTLCGPAGGYSVAENRRMLDFCQQVGLKAMVVDGRINWKMLANDDWQKTIAEIVADYGSHSALFGYYLQDEPNYAQFRTLGQMNAEFLRCDPKHLPYINLFPTYASTKQLGTPTYSDHLDKYLSIVRPAVLSYDHYCLLRDGRDRPDYFENLALIREYGQRYGTPSWNIILSAPHLAYRDPTAGEMRWQVYTSLAYGMKGIMWFTYWTLPAWGEDGGTAIVDSEGKPARLYPIVQQLNGETKVLGRTLLRLTSTGVFHTGDTPRGCRRLGDDAVLQAPADVPLVIGFFRDDHGVEYAMVVNRDHAKSVEFPLTFLPHVVSVAEISAADGTARPLTLSKQQVKLRLAAGDGRLLKLTTSFQYPEPPKPLDVIDFQFGRENDLEGWDGFHSLTGAQTREGVLSMTVTGADPFFHRTYLRIAPASYTKVKVRIKLPPCNTEGQLFWTTNEEPDFDDDKYLNFPVTPDGQWHEYEIPVATHAKWQGRAIRAVRLDPTTGGAEPGSKIEIDWIVGE